MLLGPNGQPIKSDEPAPRKEWADDKVRIFIENDPFAITPAPGSDMSNFYLVCTYKDQKWRERLTHKIAADPDKQQHQFEMKKLADRLYKDCSAYIEGEDAE
jgi:hypothetical protein